MRYVSPDGGFWEVTLVGKVVHARWGKGSKVKTREAPFKTVALAKHELDALVQKVKKLGYRPEEKPTGIAEALRASPYDDSALIVYGDELLSSGDPRGELAALVTQELKSALGKYLLANARVLFEAAENDVHEGRADDLIWAPGFVREATISVPETSDVDELVAVTKRFLAAPVSEFVRELNFGASESWGRAAEQVTRARHPELILALRFGRYDSRADDVPDAGDFSDVWLRLPELRELSIRAGSMEPGELVLPELRFLSRTGGLSSREMRAFTRAELPKLERLELGFDGEGADHAPLLAWLFQKPLTFTALALRQVQLSADEVEALLDSPLLPNLEVLDLGDVVLDEEAAQVLSDGAEDLAHLKRLSSPWMVDEDGTPTIAVIEELENLVDGAFDEL